MVRAVRRLTKPLTCLLIAAQLLLAVPAMATASVASASSSQTPCDGMPMPGGDDHCPCCPDGVNSMKGCLASCLLAAIVTPAIVILQIDSLPAEPFADIPHTLNAFSDPPLKPPPIA